MIFVLKTIFFSILYKKYTQVHWNACNLGSGLSDPNGAVLLLDLAGGEWIEMALQLQDKVLALPSRPFGTEYTLIHFH